jgi:hypothetical protein
MERTIADLPSKEFFLTNLDAPGRLDENGNVVPLTPKPAPVPDRQVRNQAHATVAAADDH